VEEAHGTGDEHDVAARNVRSRNGWPGPGALDGAALVAQHAWKMRSPVRVGSTPLRDDLADDGDVRADLHAPMRVTVLASS
jgi:hypothetical protein